MTVILQTQFDTFAPKIILLYQFNNFTFSHAKHFYSQVQTGEMSWLEPPRTQRKRSYFDENSTSLLGIIPPKPFQIIDQLSRSIGDRSHGKR